MESGDRDWHAWARETFPDPAQAFRAGRAAREARDVGATPAMAERAGFSAAGKVSGPAGAFAPPPATLPAPLPLPAPNSPVAPPRRGASDSLLIVAGACAVVLLVGGAVLYRSISLGAFNRGAAAVIVPASPSPDPAASSTPSPAPSEHSGSLCGGGTLPFPGGNGCYHPGADPGLPAPPAGVTLAPYSVNAGDWVTLVQQLRAQAPACDPRFDLPSPSVGYCVVRLRVVEDPFVHGQAGRRADGSCYVASAYVTYRLEMSLPAWNPAPGTPSELVGSYHRWLAGLYAHVRGKMRLFEADVSRLPGLVRAGSCDSGSQSAILTAWVNAANRAQIDYDRATLGGDTEAPGFP